MDLSLYPNPARAQNILDAILDTRGPKSWLRKDVHKSDLVEPIAEAAAWLRGYKLPRRVSAKYVCGDCGAHGIKLWREVHDGSRGWCAACGTAYVGIPNTVDADGCHEEEHGGRVKNGRTVSDQMYSAETGRTLLPWVIAPDGETWGYTSVPPEGCLWWKLLPVAL